MIPLLIQIKLIESLTSVPISSDYISGVEVKSNARDWIEQSKRKVGLMKKRSLVSVKLMDAGKLLCECSHVPRNVVKRDTSTGGCTHRWKRKMNM